MNIVKRFTRINQHVMDIRGVRTATKRLGFGILALLAISPMVFAMQNTPISRTINSPQIIQLTNYVYPAKFVCGFVPGITRPQFNDATGASSQVPFAPPVPSGAPEDYRDFQPGGYSSALNIFNPNSRSIDNVQVFVSVENSGTTEKLATLNIGPFQTEKLGCKQIEAIIGGNPNGEILEGFVYVKRFADDVEVQIVHSFTTLAAFKELRAGFINFNPGSGGNDIGEAGAGAGAGGLGLGGSIDIEKVHPRKSQ